MKRSLIYLVIMLLGLQVALAGITIDSLERSEYNLGEKINLKGSVGYDETVFGTMKIDLVCGDNTLPVFFSLVDIPAGESYEFNEEIPTRESFVGECNFFITVEGAADDYEKESESFKISDELKVDANVNVLLIDPGEEVIVSGSAYYLNGEIVETGKAKIMVDGETRDVELEDGLFQYNLLLSSKAESGKHEIVFKVEDLLGNKGEDEASFKVKAIPKWMEIIVDSSYMPDEVVNPKILLYDQADETIKKAAVVEVYNAEGNLEETKTISTSETFDINLERFAKPGTWRIKVDSEDLNVEKSFVVEEVRDIEIWMDESLLFVKNVGNVEYNDPIEISLDGLSEVSVVKTTSLQPNQTVQIDLNEEVDYSGEYNVNVEGFDAITGNVVLEGKKAFGGVGLGWIALIFVFIFFIYMIVKKGRGLLPKKTIKDVREKGKEILEKTNTKEDEIKQEDIDHLVEKVKKEVPIKTEKKGSSDNKNMFKIFDN